MSYKYDSAADYLKVKPFYLDWFGKNGWRVTDQYDGGWGPKSVVLTKGSFKVILYHGGMDDVEYAFICEKLSDSGEPLPNKALQLTAR
jgi:hypothetical protein